MIATRPFDQPHTLMKFDDAESYFLNATREGYTWEAAATHIGMYVTWLIEQSLFGDNADAVAVGRVKSRHMTGAEFVEEHCDGKLLDEDLSEDGLAFTEWYYERYLDDYCRHFRLDGSADALANVANTWDNYERLKPLLDGALAKWRREASTRGDFCIQLWRHPLLWRWPSKYSDAEHMLRALQSQPASDRKSITRFVDALASVDLSHDWSQLERGATLVSSLQLASSDRKSLDALISTARRTGYSLHIKEHGAFYFPNGSAVIQGEPQRFRNYTTSGNGARKTRPSGIASMHELADIACTRWAPHLARFGFRLDDTHKQETEKYIGRRFVAESESTLFRVDITAFDCVDSTRCEHPYELGLDLYFCFKQIASTRLKAHYGDAVPDNSQLPSTAFLSRSQWLADPYGLKSEVEDYLVVNDLPGLDRVIEATTEQFNARLPELLDCFSDIQTLETALNSDPIEFSIFYPGSHALCANHVVAAYLARSPRYVQICDYLMQSVSPESPAKTGRAVGAWLRDRENAYAQHLHKCIQYTARLYRLEMGTQTP